MSATGMITIATWIAAATASPRAHEEWIRALEKPEGVSANLSRAIDAVEAKDLPRAKESLDGIVISLRKLNSCPPQALSDRLMAAIDADGEKPIDFASMRALIDDDYDPAIRAAIDEAEKKYKEGERENAAAIEKLRDAHTKVVSDFALAEIGDTYARAIAARAEVDSGNDQSALRLLRGFQTSLDQLGVAAPLAASRIQLRLAAKCVDNKQWECARANVSRASDLVDAVLATAPASANKALIKRLEPIGKQINDVETRLDDGKTASAERLRHIAVNAG